MPTSGANMPRECPIDGPVSGLLSGLRGLERQPDLMALAHLVVDVCRRETSVRAVTMTINPDIAGLLDPGWTGRRVRRLTGLRDGEPQWDHGAESWLEPADSSVFLWGGGAIPEGGTFCAHREAPGWIRLHTRAAGRTALVLTLEWEDDPRDHPARGREYQHLSRVLQLVCDLWRSMAGLETELDRSESEKRALSRLNRLQSRLVGMAAHEIKTPLTSISAYADALGGLLDPEAGHPNAPEFVDVIRMESGRLLRMVNRILDFSRLDSGLRLLGGEATDMQGLVDDTLVTLRPLMAVKRIRFSLESRGAVPRAMVDADLIRQVLVNLIGNAVKFTPEGGSVTVTVAEAASTVEVRIADTGPGIPTQDIHRIFREFYRSRESAARQEGTGLGLTIVRHIINLHDGTVEARQRMGGGSVFTFRVPKEIHALGPLPAADTLKVDEAEARHVVAGILQLVAEMTDSRQVGLWLGDAGKTRPVAALGGDTPGAWDSAAPDVMESSWRTDAHGEGRLLVAGPRGRESYGAEDREQLEILSRLAVTALANLARPTTGSGEISGSAEVRKTVEALRALRQIRRGGIPTAAAEAQHLLDQLAHAMGLPEDEIRDLQLAAALHDAGMARVEDEILLGRSELSYDERDEVDRHVEQGVDLMRPLIPSERCAEIIRQHHERVDGSGYPDGLRGDQIVIGARLMAVIDAWFSLTRGRPFRPGLSRTEALQEIQENAGSQFDEDVVRAFTMILKSGCAETAAALPPGPVGSGS